MYFNLKAALTTAGKTLLDNAVANSTKVPITAVYIGAATEAVSAATTTVGAKIADASYFLNGPNIKRSRVDVNAMFPLSMTAATNGTIGIYSNTTLVAAVRLTAPVDTYGLGAQILITIDTVSAAAIAAPTSSNIVSAGAVGETFRTANDVVNAFLPSVGAAVSQTVIGTQSGNRFADFAKALPMLETAAEVAGWQSLGLTGQSYWDLRDLKYYVHNGTTWAANGNTLVGTIFKGLFYFSALNRKLYYARSTTDLFCVGQFNGWDGLYPKQRVMRAVATRRAGQVDGNSFLYEAFNAPASVVLAAGDRLVYDVRTVDPNVLFGFDGLLTNTSSVSHAMRNCGILAWTKIVDQNGYDIHPADSRPSAKSSTDWYTRSFNLNAYAGYTLSNFAYGFESDTVNGPQVGYIRNARVESNVGVVKLVILGGEIVTAANTPWLAGMDTSQEPGLKNYDFIEKRMATMYDLWNVGI